MQAGYFNAAWHDIKNSPGWFGKLARAFYVPLTCVIFVLGLVYHGIG